MQSEASNNLQSDQTPSYLKILHDTERNAILRNLVVICRKEMESNCLHRPLADYVERVAFYTNISKTNINQFISTEVGDIDYENKYFDLHHRIEILKCIANLCVNRQIPTHNNIFLILNHLDNSIGFFQFQYMISCLGFEYRSLQMGKEILLEDPDLTFERYLFLKKISDLKSKCAPIYFVDERYVDKTFTFPKPCIKNIDISSTICKGYVFFHAVSKKGFQSGLFCSPTTRTDFIKWMTHILIPQFGAPSIVVMDKNDLHTCTVNPITKYHSKKDMLQYLRKNNVPCSENLHKAELYKLIKECTIRGSYDNIEKIVRDHGHQVLWLPSTFHDLSLTHFLWKYMIESETTSLHNLPPRDLKSKILETLINLPITLWEAFDEDLSKAEKYIQEIDLQTIEALEANYTFAEKKN